MALCVTVTALAVVVPTSAEAMVYWTNQATQTIGRANLDGTSPSPRFIGAVTPASVAVDRAHVYWAGVSTRTIGRSNLDGSRRNQRFITGAGNPAGDIAVSARHIYWFNGTSIARARLDGSGLRLNFIRAQGPSVKLGGGGLAVDKRHVYWTGSVANGTGAIGRANLDGSNVNRAFIVGACRGPSDPECFSPTDVAVNSRSVYWSNNVGNGRIGRANIDGTAAQQTFITGVTTPVGIAVDGAHVYWTSDTTIGRANLNGTSVNRSFVTGAGRATGLAIDALAIAPPSFGRTVNMRTVSGTVLIRLPGSNRFVALSSVTKVPIGSTVDARQGRVEITAAADPAGRLQVGQFYEGQFKLGQIRGARRAINLELVGGDFSSCGARARAVPRAAASKRASRSKRRIRRLWGDAKGRWRTSAKGSATGVRGTIWLVEDRCDATLTRVKRGTVSVRDKARRRTVRVRAPGSYLAFYRR